VNCFTFDRGVRCYFGRIERRLRISNPEFAFPHLNEAVVDMLSVRLRASLLGLVLLLAAIAAVRGSDETETVYLAPGIGSLLRLDRPFETVLIENPRVVDVKRENDRAVVLKALALGTSSVVFIDEHSIAIANIRVVVSDART
jgi:Flp pilus assembly secretin CpaC